MEFNLKELRHVANLKVAIGRLDADFLQWIINRPMRKLLLPFMAAISRIADGYGYVLVGLLIASLKPDLGFCYGLAFAMERTLYQVCKPSMKRRRPEEILVNFSSVIRPSDQYSFPSGHTSAAFLFATLLYLFFGSHFSIFFLFAGLVGIARIMLGVHFPLDTIAGAVLGILCGILAHACTITPR